jgi:hypothetical protein
VTDPKVKARAEAEALYKEGLVLARDKQWAKAIEKFDEALKKLPDDAGITKSRDDAREALRIETERLERQRRNELFQETLKRRLDELIAAFERDASAAAGDLLEPKGDSTGGLQPKGDTAGGLQRKGDEPAGSADNAALEQQLDDAARVDPRLATLVSDIRKIRVPPPIRPEEADIHFGQLAPRDERTRHVLFGAEAGYAALDVALEFSGKANLTAKAIILAGKTIIAGEEGAEVYLVKQDKLYEQALAWIKEPAASRQFTGIVRAIRAGKEPPDDAPPAMIRAARAILDPRLGNSGLHMAWDSLWSPEARHAAVTQACIQLGGEIVGQAAEAAVGKFVVERAPAFERAARLAERARLDMAKASTPAFRQGYQAIIAKANKTMAEVYQLHRVGAHGMGYVESLYTTETLEENLQRKD